MRGSSLLLLLALGLLATAGCLKRETAVERGDARQILHRSYFQNDFIFVRPAVSTEYIEDEADGKATFIAYYPTKENLRDVLKTMVQNFGLKLAFDDLDRDIDFVYDALKEQVGGVRLRTNFQIQVLSSLFFRNKGAYIVGKVINGFRSLPFAIPILHNSKNRLYIDAALFGEDDLLALFSFARAYFMVDMAHYAGLIAAGVYPNPVPHADVVTSTTHKSLRGPRGGIILMKAEHEKAINSAIFPGLQGGPLMHVIAAKAVAFKEALQPEFKAYQQQVAKNAQIVAETLTQRGLRIVSGRTESHVFLVDLRAKNLTGKEAEAALGRAHITVNKNAIPFDPLPPNTASGIRIGTPAICSRGFGVAEAVARALRA